MTPKPHTALPTDCDAISEAFLALHEQDGFTRLPPSSLLHDSVPMSFVMSAGLIQVENDLEKIVEETGGKFAFTQPCFRHFDMKQVGEDPTRLSLFHMSAAFHIGCSERETVLPRLWHFLTEVLGLEKDRLWVTYLDDAEFGRDEASYQCWKSLGVAEERLVGLDQHHCFWRQRSLGQIASDGKKCGPHTEVFYERDVACPACENSEQPIGSCRCGRFVEISNSLFIENYIGDDGKLIPADTVFAECVLGLERTEMVLRSLPDVYHVKRFDEWREQITRAIPDYNASPQQQQAASIILDHLWAFVRLTEDGAPAPGRGGRKYIMRKLARKVREQISDQNASSPDVIKACLYHEHQMAGLRLQTEFDRSLKAKQKNNSSHSKHFHLNDDDTYRVTAMESSTQNVTTDKWETASSLVDCLQNLINETHVTTEQLIHKLKERFPPDFPAPMTALSVIYQPYLSPNKHKIVVLRGELPEKDHTLPAYPFDEVATDHIVSVIDTGVPTLGNNLALCQNMGFGGCGSVLIVPMRVDNERIIGAFILENPEEFAFNKQDERIIDRVSDRFAAIIRFVDQNRRSAITHAFLADLSASSTAFKNEFDIFQAVVEHLLKGNSDKQTTSWFSSEELNVVLQHPFYDDKLYHVCQKGEVILDFRKNAIVEKVSLVSLLGDNVNRWFESKDATIINEDGDVIANHLPEGYQSYAIIPMAIRNRVIGLFVLRNVNYKSAYKDEESLLEQVAKFTAVILRDFRNNHISKQRQKFRKKFIRGQQPVEDAILYNACHEIIQSNFGSTDFFVLSKNRKTNKLELTYKSSSADPVFDNQEIEKYIEEIDKNADKSSELISLENFFELTEPEKTAELTSDKRYSIFSTRAESGHVTNIILIGSNKSLGWSTTAILSELFAITSFKQSLDRKKARLKAMTDFGKAITETVFTPDNYLEQVYELTNTYVDSYILMQNMYIALLDHKNKLISFPLFMRKNSDGELEKIEVEPRIFDSGAKVIPRTECILIDKRPILIKTMDESKKWYEDHGDSEQIGSPFASWLGVPILSNGDAIGVIAVYHPTANYLYTDGDKLFLENIASHFSSLLNLIKLKEAIANNTALKKANRQLEEANKELEEAKQREQQLLQSAQQEERSIRKFIFDQLQKRTNDTVFEVEQAIEVTLKDIKHYREINNTPNALEDIFIMQHDAHAAIMRMKDVLDNMSTANKKDHIDISYMIKSILDDLQASVYVIETTKSRNDRVEMLANQDDCFVSFFSLWKNIVDLVSNAKTQAKYEINKAQGKIILRIILDKKIQTTAIEEAIAIPRIISNRRIGAITESDPENHSVIIWSLSISEPQAPILIVGGSHAIKRKLQNLLLTIGENAQLSDKLVDSDDIKVVFILDPEVISSKYKGKAVLIIAGAAINLNDGNFFYENADKQKLLNKDYLEALLKKVGYYA